MGRSSAIRSKELAAVLETLFCSLYSSLDCTRYVLKEIYPNHRGLNDTTTATFQNGHSGKLDSRLPIESRDAISATSDWFPELSRVRTAVTHANVGFSVGRRTPGPRWPLKSPPVGHIKAREERAAVAGYSRFRGR